MARLRPARWIACALLLFPAIQSAVAQAGPPPQANSIGVLMPYLSPDEPLLDGAGLMFRYARFFPHRAPPDSTQTANSSQGRRALVLSASVASVSMDRDSQGATLQGKVTLRYPSVGLGESWSLKGGKWTLTAGGGLDYFFPDGEGDFSVGAPIGISNDYEVDSGLGYYAEFDAGLALGAGWEFVFGAGYLLANLDGEQRFVVSGVSGAPISADFDLSGPQATLGLAYRF